MGKIIYTTAETKSKKIKPCPFCGGEATLRRDVRYPRPKCNPRQAWEVICKNHKCCVYDADTRYFFSKKAAISAWNDRKLGCEHEQMLADGELVSKEWHDEQVGHAELVIEEQKAELEEWEKLFDISNEREYRKKFNEEWKKEYQKKMDERGDGAIAGFPDFDLVYKLYFEQKAEIERLTKEKNDWKQRYDSESNRYTDLCSASSECVQKKNDRIAELQKQVDKACLEVGKMCMEERKDTAKEICLEIIKGQPQPIKEKWVEWFKERYGAEVE
ncbi:MAG: Lar family restriction alleviation protein [Clostridia bacterium]|nr:Lar family restriction alleviation protein [Clostridia bacterium]